MKKVFLYVYDQVNLGDDLFVHTITNRYPNVKFYLWSSAVNKTNFSCLKNLVILDPDSSLIRFLKKLRPSLGARYKNRKEGSCDSIVYIGGSLFIEYENWQTILTWWKYAAENRKLYVIGANFGPWHTEDYQLQMGEIFRRMKDVCFRDKYSSDLFKDSPTVRYAPDILLGYPMPKVEVQNKQAFISVINCENKDEGENQLAAFDRSYVAGMTDLVKQLTDKGWKVILSSFCKAEGDENGIQKILDQIEDLEYIEIFNYNGKNDKAILKKIAESEIVYGTRFHAVILGIAAHRPVVPLIYSNKTKNILDDMNFPGKSFNIREFGDDFGKQAAALAYHPENQSIPDIEKYAKQSEEHFLKLDQQFM